MSHDLTLKFIEKLPEIRRLLSLDARAAYIGDPAAKSIAEVIFCYPGLFATLVFRLAHELFKLQVPIIPRIMTEYAHSKTGISSAISQPWCQSTPPKPPIIQYIN